jgi:hypothetical protein
MGVLSLSFPRFKNSRNVEVPAGTGTNRSCPGKRHERGSFPGHEHVFFRPRSRATNTAFYILLSDPAHTDTGFIDKTKPHGLFLKG